MTSSEASKNDTKAQILKPKTTTPVQSIANDVSVPVDVKDAKKDGAISATNEDNDADNDSDDDSDEEYNNPKPAVLPNQGEDGALDEEEFEYSDDEDPEADFCFEDCKPREVVVNGVQGGNGRAGV